VEYVRRCLCMRDEWHRALERRLAEAAFKAESRGGSLGITVSFITSRLEVGFLDVVDDGVFLAALNRKPPLPVFPVQERRSGGVRADSSTRALVGGVRVGLWCGYGAHSWVCIAGRVQDAPISTTLLLTTYRKPHMARHPGRCWRSQSLWQGPAAEGRTSLTTMSTAARQNRPTVCRAIPPLSLDLISGRFSCREPARGLRRGRKCRLCGSPVVVRRAQALISHA
jgi:hypothetical protein